MRRGAAEALLRLNNARVMHLARWPPSLTRSGWPRPAYPGRGERVLVCGRRLELVKGVWLLVGHCPLDFGGFDLYNSLKQLQVIL